MSSGKIPLDVFSWLHMKSLVYKTSVGSEEDFIAKIAIAVGYISDYSEIVGSNLLWNVCKGRHFSGILVIVLDEIYFLRIVHIMICVEERRLIHLCRNKINRKEKKWRPNVSLNKWFRIKETFFSTLANSNGNERAVINYSEMEISKTFNEVNIWI